MSRKNGGIIGPANTPVGGLFKGVAGGVWRMNDVANFVSNSQWPSTPQSIDNSCRFDDASVDYLSRTPSSSGSNRKFTFSAWVKRSHPSNEITMISQNNSANNARDCIRFNGGDQVLRIFLNDANTASFVSNAQYRDVSAWYHVVVNADTTQATASNRLKAYINGEQITSWHTNTEPSQNADLLFNSNNLMTIGRDSKDSNAEWEGYMAEVVFIDGLQLDPTSFGETDSTTGIWKPKKIGTFSSAGTNSFYLDFKDSSNLGNDASGLNNDFTVNNLTSIDQSTDTCVENFATLNPLNQGRFQTAVFSNGNLEYESTQTGASYPRGISTIGVNTGKWYMEVKNLSSQAVMLGISNGDSYGGVLPDTTNDIGYQSANGYLYKDGSGQVQVSTYTTNDIIGIALDLDNYKVYFSKNGTWQNSGDPTSGATGTGAISVTNPSATGFYFFTHGETSSSATPNITCNFGSPSFSISSGNADANGFGNFEYAVPSGYYALNTSNLNTYG